MRSVLAGLLVALLAWSVAPAQDLPVLRIKVSVLDADRRAIPARAHALLISDNPATAAPRRVVTSAEGAAQVRLQPGNYTVESDRPFVLDGRGYEWVQTVDLVLGQDTTLELTAANAAVDRVTAAPRAEAVAADGPSDVAPAVREPAPSSELVLSTWQGSVFGLWTPLRHAAAFLADSRGLLTTSLRAIGDVTTVEVEVSQAVKVTGAVVVADESRDVAVVRVHPSVVDGVVPVPLPCEGAVHVPVGRGRHVIDVPLFGPKDLSPSLSVSAGGAGGPVFAEDGRFVGLSSPAEDANVRGLIDVRVVAAADICEALVMARSKMDAAAPPDAARLPVEPTRRLPPPTATARAFTLTPYQLSSSDFDITFLTPPVLAAADARRDWTGGSVEQMNRLRAATEFDNWSEYVAGAPPQLYVRVTPRLVESFWMKLARGAASTQGAEIPPIKRLRPGFSRMRLVCGDKAVTPVHPFRIQARVTETEAVEEGFYVFEAGAIGPECGSVSIVLSSVKDPSKTETRTVDPAIVRRVWDDFADVRTAPAN